jgi:hypothetical protein
MKRNLIKQSARLKNLGYLMELLAWRTELPPMRLLRLILNRLDRDLSRIDAKILQIEITWNRKLNTKKETTPGAMQEWYGYDTPYRCWACIYLGKSCDNPFTNRPACSNFIFNSVLQNNMNRAIKKMTGAKMKRLKPPLLISFSRHLEKCRICGKTKSSKRISINQRIMKHYDKYRTRRIKKLLSFLSYYGITYQENYRWGWEK